MIASERQSDTVYPRSGVDAYLIMFDHALSETFDEFGYGHWHSLLWNLHNVHDEQWNLPARGGSRTIQEMVKHVGSCYLIYENHAFGDATRGWQDGDLDGSPPGTTPAELVAYLSGCHATFRRSLSALDDSRLDDLVPAPWGEQLPVRRIVEIMIQNGLYHAGEINLIRALHQNNDDWNHTDIGREETVGQD